MAKCIGKSTFYEILHQSAVKPDILRICIIFSSKQGRINWQIFKRSGVTFNERTVYILAI